MNQTVTSKFRNSNVSEVDPSGRAVRIGLRPLSCWYFGFISRRVLGSPCCESRVLLRKAACVGLFTRPRESCGVRCVYV